MFGVSLDEAQHLVDTQGVVAPQPDPLADRQVQKAITDATAETASELVRQLKRTLHFLESQRRHLHADAIWLMGGGASMRNIGPYFDQALNLPVHICGAALQEPPSGETATQRGGGFQRRVGPFGTSLEGRMKNSINLLPASFRRQQIVRQRAYQWSAVICLVLVAGWIFHWYELREQQAMVQRLEVLKREHQPTQLMLRQLVDMRQETRGLGSSKNGLPESWSASATR